MTVVLTAQQKLYKMCKLVCHLAPIKIYTHVHVTELMYDDIIGNSMSGQYNEQVIDSKTTCYIL